jgi:hypothetical protein
MTDRVSGLVVFLEKSTREDDVQGLIRAIRLFNGVVDVKLGPVDTPAEYMARHSERQDLARVLVDTARELGRPSK